jgi:hypothetical protein
MEGGRRGPLMVVGSGDRVLVGAPRRVRVTRDHVFKLSSGNTSYWEESS